MGRLRVVVFIFLIALSLVPAAFADTAIIGVWFRTAPHPFAGELFDMTVEVSGYASATINPGNIVVPTGITTVQTSVDGPTLFWLIADQYGPGYADSLRVIPTLPVATLLSRGDVFPGEMAVLDVFGEGGQSWTLEPGFGSIAGTGTYSIAILDTTTFTLRGSNPMGEVVRTATVATRAPLIQSFTIRPQVPLMGEQTQIAWNVLGSTSIALTDTITGQVLATDLPGFGSMLMNPTVPVGLQLAAANRVGVTTQVRDIDPAPILIREFTSSAGVVAPGEQAQLSWTAEGVGELELVGLGSQPLVGGMSVQPAATTTYELVARSNAVVYDSKSLTISLVDPNTNILAWSASGQQYSSAPVVLEALVPTDVFIVARSPAGGIRGVEAHAVIPPDLLVLETEVLPLGATATQSADDWIIDMAACVNEPAPFVPLLRYRLFTLNHLDSQPRALDLDPITNATLAPPSVGYRDCAGVVAPMFESAPLPIVGDAVVGNGPHRGRHTRWLGASPNPFNPKVELRFEVGGQGPVSIEVYDLAGRRVRADEVAIREATEQNWVWNGDDDSGMRVGSGVYLVRLRAGEAEDTTRITLVR